MRLALLCGFIILHFLGVSQESTTYNNDFSIFKIQASNLDEVDQVESKLVSNPDLIMVRVDKLTNVVFIVSNENINLSDLYLKNILGDLYDKLGCISFGRKGYTEMNFENVVNCKSN